MGHKAKVGMDPPPSNVEFKQFELSEKVTERWIVFYKIMLFYACLSLHWKDLCSHTCHLQM